MADISSVTLRTAGDQGELRRFRNDFYDCLSAWPDALFELLDAVCNPLAVAGIAHLSLAATAARAVSIGQPSISAASVTSSV